MLLARAASTTLLANGVVFVSGGSLVKVACPPKGPFISPACLGHWALGKRCMVQRVPITIQTGVPYLAPFPATGPLLAVRPVCFVLPKLRVPLLESPNVIPAIAHFTWGALSTVV